MKKLLMSLVITVFALFAVFSQTFAVAPTITLDESQWNNGFNSEWVSYIPTWATEQELTSAEVKTLAEAAMNTSVNLAITDGVISESFDFGNIDSFGEWSGVLKLELRDGDHTADIYGRRHAMVVLSPASFNEDGSVEAFLMINDLFTTWFNKGGFDTVGYPVTKPFVHEDVLYQNFSKGYVDDENNFFVDQHITFTGTTHPIGEAPVDTITITLDESQWNNGFNSEWVSYIPTWATEQELTSAEIRTLAEAAMNLSIQTAITDGIIDESFDFGNIDSFGEWSGVLKLELRDGDHTADIYGRRHAMVVLSPASFSEEGTVEAFLMINALFTTWFDEGGFDTVGYPVTKPFIYEDVQYQNFSKGYVDDEGNFVVDKQIALNGDIYDIGEEPEDPEDPEEPVGITLDQNQWNNGFNSEWVAFVPTWATEQSLTSEEVKALVEVAMQAAIDQAIIDGIIDETFDLGNQDSFSEWSGILKLELRDGDHTADIYGRRHAMLVLSPTSLNEDGTIEIFLMINDLFTTWFNEGGFDTVGYPVSKPFIHNGTQYQNFSKGFVDENDNFTAGEHITFEGETHEIGELPTPPNYLGVLAETDGGEPIETHPAYGWVRELGAAAIKAEVERVYAEMAALGFDFGEAKEPVRLWSAAGDGSGGAEETKWLRQEFIGGDHEAYLWNRVHGYIFINQQGEGFAVFNEILLEWHGGWSDKGGPTSQPIYVTVEYNGLDVTDVYQNFQNAYIVVPSGDRSLAQIISSQSVTPEEALEETRIRYGLNDTTPGPDEEDPDDEEEPTEETPNRTILIISLSVLGAVSIGGASLFFIKKFKK